MKISPAAEGNLAGQMQGGGDVFAFVG